MRQIIVENTVINFTFDEPARYLGFTADGIVNEIASRRPSLHIVPSPTPARRRRVDSPSIPSGLKLTIVW
jgi:hypothetical protein